MISSPAYERSKDLFRLSREAFLGRERVNESDRLPLDKGLFFYTDFLEMTDYLSFLFSDFLSLLLILLFDFSLEYLGLR